MSLDSCRQRCSKYPTFTFTFVCVRDRLMAKQISAKLSSMEEYIRQLQTSQSFITQHQKARQARDKLTKF